MSWLRWLTVTLVAVGCARERPLVGPDAGVVFRERSAFQTVLVVDEDGRRCLRFGEVRGSLNQSCIVLDQPQVLSLEYARLVTALAVGWVGEPKRVLIIGLGGGSLPLAFRRVRPEWSVEVVELDPVVVTAATRYFGVKPDSKLSIVVGDGRDVVLQRVREGAHYDLVVLDAFDDVGIVPGLFDAPFLNALKQLVGPTGGVLANTFDGAPKAAQELARARSIFAGAESMRVRRNRIVFAGDGPLPTRATLVDLVKSERGTSLHAVGVDAAFLADL